jgi:uncharacterized membrane protein (DUF2068 family)
MSPEKLHNGATKEARVNDIKLHKAPHRWPLVLIALDKLVKGALLILLSFVLLPRWNQPVRDWIDYVQLGPHNWIVTHALLWLETALGYPTRTLHLIRVCVIIYAGLYFIEGVGLIFEQKWAEWVVIIATIASLPVEIFDFIRHPRWAMVILFILNLLMAGYLAWRLHRQAVIKRELAEHPELAGKK